MFPLDFESLPRLTRHTYRLEVVHLTLWAGLVAMLEGGIASVIVAKTFHGSAWQISVVRATPVVTNMLSIAWGVMAVTRPKIPLLTMACGGAAIAMACTALVPAGYAWSGWMFAGQMVLARIFLSGVATLRTAIWKVNYPADVRGRLAGRLQLRGTVSRLVTIYLASWVLDLDPAKENLLLPARLIDYLGLNPAASYLHAPHLLVDWGGPMAYRWLYPLLSLVGAVAILLLQFIHVRGDRSLNRAMLQKRQLGPITPRARAIEPYSLTAILSPALRPLHHMVEILRRDKAFRVYQIAQMFSGAANLLIDPILVIIFVRELQAGLYAFNRHAGYHSGNSVAEHCDPLGEALRPLGPAKVPRHQRWGLDDPHDPGRCGGGLHAIHGADGPRLCDCRLHLRRCPDPHGNRPGWRRDRVAAGTPAFCQTGRGRALYGLACDVDGARGWLGFVGAPLYLWCGWPVFAVAAVLSATGLILYRYGMTTYFRVAEIRRKEPVAASRV